MKHANPTKPFTISIEFAGLCAFIFRKSKPKRPPRVLLIDPSRGSNKAKESVHKPFLVLKKLGQEQPTVIPLVGCDVRITAAAADTGSELRLTKADRSHLSDVGRIVPTGRLDPACLRRGKPGNRLVAARISLPGGSLKALPASTSAERPRKSKSPRDTRQIKFRYKARSTFRGSITDRMAYELKTRGQTFIVNIVPFRGRARKPIVIGCDSTSVLLVSLEPGLLESLLKGIDATPSPFTLQDHFVAYFELLQQPVPKVDFEVEVIPEPGDPGTSFCPPASFKK